MLDETSNYSHNDRNGFKGQSGLTTHYKNDGISFGMGSIALLDMLAEVASQTLQSDPTMNSSPNVRERELIHKSWEPPEEGTPTKEIFVRKSGKHKSKKPVDNHTLSIKRRKSGSCKDYRGTKNISGLSANSLIKRFSEFDGDEMRRTFTFTCTFDRGHCQQRFSSFGSENKARQHMKDHLLQHVETRKWEVPSDLAISSKPRNGVEKQPLPDEACSGLKKKKKRKPKNVIIPNSYTQASLGGNAYDDLTHETLWRPGVVKTLHEDNNNVVKTSLSTSGIANNVAPRLHTQKEGSNAFMHETKWMPSVGYIVTNQHTKEKMSNAYVQDTYSSELIVVKLEEEESSVYSEHNYMKQESHSLTIDANLDDSICLSVIQEETADDEFQPSSINDETTSYDGMQKATNIKSMLFKRLICEDDTTSHYTLGEKLNKMATTFELDDEGQQLQSLPYIGQEVDVNTSQLPASLSAISSIHLETKMPVHSVDVNTERDSVFATESMSSKIKKNKSNSKLLGQSEAEKNLAIRLIESIKYKGSHPDSLECNICSPTRFFTALTTLISHYRSHAGIKPYECRLCGHVFTRQHSLNYHLLIHGNVTRFECADCGRKFRHPSHFKEHRRRHTGEAPYECLDCPLRFKTRNTYKRHLKTRHGKVLTTSGGLISLSDEELGQVGTASQSQPTTLRAHTNDDDNKAFISEESNDDGEDFSQNNDQHSTDDNKHLPSTEELDKENSMTNVNNKTGINRNKSLISANEAFHDIVEEAMRQSDISFHIEPDNASQVSKEPNNNNGFDASKNVSNNEMVQQNIGVNTLFITKIAQNCSLSSESTFSTILKVPSLISKIHSKPENEPGIPKCSSVYDKLLKQSVTVNVTPVLTGNINTFNASYQRNILPRVKPANISTEFRIICPNTSPTAIMLVTGHPSAKPNG